MPSHGQNLDPVLQQWLDRLAEIYDDHELYADMRPIGEVIRPIVCRIVSGHSGRQPATTTPSTLVAEFSEPAET